MTNRRNVLASLFTLPAVALATQRADAAPRGGNVSSPSCTCGEASVASETSAGIVSTVDQSFAGTKTFVNGVTLAAGASLALGQGGTDSAPALERLWQIQPRQAADGRVKASYAAVVTSPQFESTYDEVLDIGYNVTNANPTLPSARFTIESDYEYAPSLRQMEMHGQFSSQGAGTGTSWRWITGQFRGYDTLGGDVGIFYRDGSNGDAGALVLSESTASTPAIKIQTSGISFYTKDITWTSTGVFSMSGGIAPDDITAPQDMVFYPQAPIAGATGSNRKPGNFTVQLAAPEPGGAEAQVFFRRGNDEFASFRADGLMELIDLTATNFFTVYNDGSTHVQAGKGRLYIDNATRDIEMVCGSALFTLASPQSVVGPTVDGNGALGNDGARWGSVRATTVKAETVALATALAPENWEGTPPADLNAALDRMAALLRTLNGGRPIP